MGCHMDDSMRLLFCWRSSLHFALNSKAVLLNATYNEANVTFRTWICGLRFDEGGVDCVPLTSECQYYFYHHHRITDDSKGICCRDSAGVSDLLVSRERSGDHRKKGVRYLLFYLAWVKEGLEFEEVYFQG